MKGLIVKPKWADLILDGKKTMELRGTNTKIRGKIGIIKSGSKMVYGTVELVEVVPILDEETYIFYNKKHLVDYPFSNIPYKKLYGWILKKPVRYNKPIPYKHKQGCVIWVNLIE